SRTLCVSAFIPVNIVVQLMASSSLTSSMIRLSPKPSNVYLLFGNIDSICVGMLSFTILPTAPSILIHSTRLFIPSSSSGISLAIGSGVSYRVQPTKIRTPTHSVIIRWIILLKRVIIHSSNYSVSTCNSMSRIQPSYEGQNLPYCDPAAQCGYSGCSVVSGIRNNVHFGIDQTAPHRVLHRRPDCSCPYRSWVLFQRCPAILR